MRKWGYHSNISQLLCRVLISNIPQSAQLERKAGVDFVAKNVSEIMLFISCTTSPYLYQESQHVVGFEKSFSKETYLNLTQHFPNIWSQNLFWWHMCPYLARYCCSEHGLGNHCLKVLICQGLMASNGRVGSEAQVCMSPNPLSLLHICLHTPWKCGCFPSITLVQGLLWFK